MWKFCLAVFAAVIVIQFRPAPPDVIEAALAHIRGDATVQAYFRSDLFDKRRDLMTAWAAHCTAEQPPAV
jgi:hypothetical protein